MTAHRPVTLCGAKNRAGLPCKRPSGWGTDHAGFGHCKLHGGASPTGGKHAERQRELWRDRLADQIDPAMGTLIGIMLDAGAADRDRIAAARDLLDRAGVKTGSDGLADGLVVNIAIIPEWPLVLSALEPYPAARQAVRQALKMP
jgi:hypothetical protein